MSKQYIIEAQKAFQTIGIDLVADGIFGSDSLKAVNELIKKSGIEPIKSNDNITKHFTMRELTHSSKAVARGINNVPSGVHKSNLIEATEKLFEPIREILGHPINISSGYRSEAVNKAVGGSNTSAHSVGFAIDFKCPGYGNTTKVAECLVRELYTRKIAFDQLILEFPNTGNTWVHLGYKSPSGQQRKQILTAKKVSGKTKYFTGLL